MLIQTMRYYACQPSVDFITQPHVLRTGPNLDGTCAWNHGARLLGFAALFSHYTYAFRYDAGPGMSWLHMRHVVGHGLVRGYTMLAHAKL